MNADKTNKKWIYPCLSVFIRGPFSFRFSTMKSCYTLRNIMKKHLAVFFVLMISIAARGEEITVGTYNIDMFHDHFLAHKIATSRPSWINSPDGKEIMEDERHNNDVENWEVALVILDPAFSPDILMIQEGCGQSDLEYFNHHWLHDAYETVTVFPTNTERDQNLCMLAKPGFKVLDTKDDYYKEPDTVSNERGDRLFARGPAFVLMQSPGGYRFWIGTNHQKSKFDNSLANTAWRNREAKRTHQIIKEIEKIGTGDVVFMGDMNDELGIQQYEEKAGGDVIANLVGSPEDGLILATKPLIQAGEISYGGYWKPEHRSFIDQIIVTSAMKDKIEKVQVFHNNFTDVASDHYPVMMKFNAGTAATTQPAVK
jgi:hypothetical protein